MYKKIAKVPQSIGQVKGKCEYKQKMLIAIIWKWTGEKSKQIEMHREKSTLIFKENVEHNGYTNKTIY